MTWSRAGTVSVTQNSNAVIGTGTAFIGDSRVGDAFIGPDGALYEVTNIASNTALAISPAYKGASSAAGVYALAPIQGYNKDTADALRAASLQVGDALDGLEESVTEAAASAVTATAAKEVVLVSAATAGAAASAAASSESHVVTLASAVEDDASSSAAAAAAAQASKEAAAISEANAAASAGTVANALIKTGGTMSGALNLAPIVSIASSAIPAIGAAAANTITITGTIGITGFDAIASGAVRTLIFAGVVPLTHHATKLILPKGANITTAAGDVLEFTSLGGGNWRCTGKLLVADSAAWGSITGLLSAQTDLQAALDAKSSLGVGQSWQTVTSSRAVGTTYTNSTGKPIQVAILCGPTSGTNVTTTLNINSQDIRGTYAAAASQYIASVSAIVPAGATYSLGVLNGTAPLFSWQELRS